RARSANDPIEISTQKRNGGVLITMSSHVPEVRETHDLAALIEATRAEIALGKDLLERIAGEMGGDFTFKRQRDGRERLAFRLELSRRKSLPARGKSLPPRSAPADSNRSSPNANDLAEAFDGKGHKRRRAT